MDYFEAITHMHNGNVVKYIGTANGDIKTTHGCSWCMQRGIIFAYQSGKVVPNSVGSMVYDPSFRYVLTGETVDPRSWPNMMKSFREQYHEKKRLDEISRTGIDGYCICCGAADYVESGQQHDSSCVWFEPIEKQNSPLDLTKD